MAPFLSVPVVDGVECLDANPARSRLVAFPVWIQTDRYPLVVFRMAHPVDCVRGPGPLAVRAISRPVPLRHNAGLRHVGTNGFEIDLLDGLARPDRVTGSDARCLAHDDIGRFHPYRGQGDV